MKTCSEFVREPLYQNPKSSVLFPNFFRATIKKYRTLICTNPASRKLQSKQNFQI